MKTDPDRTGGDCHQALFSLLIWLTRAGRRRGKTLPPDSPNPVDSRFHFLCDSYLFWKLCV